MQPSLSLLQGGSGSDIRLNMGSTFMMQVTARDDSGQVCPNATRQLPSGMLAPNGPPTTLSPKGVDRLGFLQGNLTRDATYFVNGSPIGARDIFVVRFAYISCAHSLLQMLGPTFQGPGIALCNQHFTLTSTQ